MTDFLVQEDGVSKLVEEDASGSLLLETAASIVTDSGTCVATFTATAAEAVVDQATIAGTGTPTGAELVADQATIGTAGSPSGSDAVNDAAAVTATASPAGTVAIGDQATATATVSVAGVEAVATSDQGTAAATFSFGGGPGATVLAKVDSFACPAGTGNFSLTGLGFTPEALLVWCNRLTADGQSWSGTQDGDAPFSFGIFDGAAYGCLLSTDDFSAGNPSSTNKLIQLWGYTQGEIVTATGVSLDAASGGGFTLNFSHVSSGVVINFLALGGSGLSAKVISSAMPTTAIPLALTGAGFAPDAAILVGGAFNSTLSGNSSPGRMGFGMVSSLTQRAANTTAYDGLAASRWQRTDRAYAEKKAFGVAGLAYEADVQSLDSDGLTLNVTTASNEAHGSTVYALCLKGVNFKVGSFTQPGATGNQSVTTGFTPAAVLFSSVGKVAGTAIDTTAIEWQVGATDGTRQSVVGMADRGGIAGWMNRSNVYEQRADNATPTLDSHAQLASFDTGVGFTLNYTAVDATARESIYFAVGSIVGGGGGGNETIIDQGAVTDAATPTVAAETVIDQAAVTATITVSGQEQVIGGNPTDAGTVTLVWTPTGTELVLDQGTMTSTASPAEAEIVIDQTTVTATGAPSGADAIADQATAIATGTPAAAAATADQGTGQGTASPSAAETVNDQTSLSAALSGAQSEIVIDQAADLATFTPSGTGSVLSGPTDQGTVTVTFTPAGSELVLDLATLTATATPTSAETVNDQGLQFVVTYTGPGVLSFDGTAGYARVADAATVRVETNNAFTYSFWATVRSLNNNVLPRFLEKNADYICVMGDPTNGRYRNIGLEVVDTAAAAHEFWGNTRLQPGQRVHVVVAFDGAVGGTAQCTMYVNGTAETVTAIVAWPGGGTLQSTVGQDLFIARRHTDLLRNLNGELDSLCFWQRALTPAEAATVYVGQAPLPAGATVVLPMREGTGTVARDVSGNGNDATVTSAPWMIGPATETVIDQAAATATFTPSAAEGKADTGSATSTATSTAAELLIDQSTTQASAAAAAAERLNDQGATAATFAPTGTGAAISADAGTVTILVTPSGTSAAIQVPWGRATGTITQTGRAAGGVAGVRAATGATVTIGADGATSTIRNASGAIAELAEADATVTTG